MPTPEHLDGLGVQLAIGAAAGAAGALARELHGTERELSWLLIPKTVSGLCLGTLGLVAAGAMGVEDWRLLYAAGFTAGMVGQAAMIDIARAVLRARLGLPKQ
jgi:hypothetical protein